jgi:hypothetical protein
VSSRSPYGFACKKGNLRSGAQIVALNVETAKPKRKWHFAGLGACNPPVGSRPEILRDKLRRDLFLGDQARAECDQACNTSLSQRLMRLPPKKMADWPAQTSLEETEVS